MKKYKLIKEYPGSPKLGTVVFSKNDSIIEDKILYYYNDTSGCFIVLSKKQTENFPEFWEEVIEKDYEILQHSTISINYESFTEPRIYSIRRLSDGEVFTVGDRINDKYIIVRFKISKCSDSILVYLNTGGCISLNRIYHSKKPMFITEDGVEIFEGDKYYFILIDSTIKSNDWIINTHICDWKNPKMPPLGKKQFSTRKAAQNYIKCHKPILSYNDVLTITDNLKLRLDRNEFKKQLTKLVNEKL